MKSEKSELPVAGLTSFQHAKGDPSLMEDVWMANDRYIAVFDGATPKTAFRFPDGRTPGQVAAQTLAQCLGQLPADLSAREAIDRLTEGLSLALDGHRGEASGVIYNVAKREIWMVGDCQFAFIYPDGTIERHHTEKAIDRILSQWRASIIRSYLSRGLMTPDEVLANDPGRRIIQPFITRQVAYQNPNINPNLNPLRASARVTEGNNPDLAFGVFDGTPVPDRFIEIYPIPEGVTEVILASDGYPSLLPTLAETEAHLSRLLKEDPLCIGPLCGTKGIKPGNEAHDDRTYVKTLLCPPVQTLIL